MEQEVYDAIIANSLDEVKDATELVATVGSEFIAGFTTHDEAGLKIFTSFQDVEEVIERVVTVARQLLSSRLMLYCDKDMMETGWPTTLEQSDLYRINEYIRSISPEIIFSDSLNVYPPHIMAKAATAIYMSRELLEAEKVHKRDNFNPFVERMHCSDLIVTISEALFTMHFQGAAVRERFANVS